MLRSAIVLATAFLVIGCSEKPRTSPDEEATKSAPDVVAPDAATPDVPEVSVPEARAPGVSTIAKVNLNTATREQFLALPEVTERMAHEFDEYRPFASIRQFRKEIGKYVDEAQVAHYEKFVFVPVVPNDCDSETLQQIPGVDAAKADAIIAGRPYPSTEAFLEALALHVGESASAAARAYLTE